MSRLQLSAAMGDYDRTRALFDGRVQIDASERLTVMCASGHCNVRERL